MENNEWSVGNSEWSFLKPEISDYSATLVVSGIKNNKIDRILYRLFALQMIKGSLIPLPRFLFMLTDSRPSEAF